MSQVLTTQDQLHIHSCTLMPAVSTSPTLNIHISILSYLILHDTIEFNGVSKFFECLKFCTFSVTISWKFANFLSRQIRNRRGQTVVFRLTPTLCIKLLNNTIGYHMSKKQENQKYLYQYLQKFWYWGYVHGHITWILRG